MRPQAVREGHIRVKRSGDGGDGVALASVGLADAGVEHERGFVESHGVEVGGITRGISHINGDGAAAHGMLFEPLEERADVPVRLGRREPRTMAHEGRVGGEDIRRGGDKNRLVCQGRGHQGVERRACAVAVEEHTAVAETAQIAFSVCAPMIAPREHQADARAQEQIAETAPAAALRAEDVRRVPSGGGRGGVLVRFRGFHGRSPFGDFCPAPGGKVTCLL